MVAIENGGTNAITVLGAKKNLEIQNVDNTRDIDKVISNKTLVALNLKEDLSNKSNDVLTDGASDSKYPTVKSVKIYVDASSNSNASALTNEVSRAKTVETTIANSLATETANRTSANTALTTSLDSEVARAKNAENEIAAKLTSANSALTTSLGSEVTRAKTAETTIADNLVTETANRISANTVLTTNLESEVSRAKTAETTIADNLATETVNRISANTILTTNLALEVTNRVNADLLKEDAVNKSTNVNTDGTSDTKYPSVKSVKTYIDEASATTTSVLALKAPLDSPTFTGTVGGITKAMIGLGDVYNTTDIDKPISNATQSALDLKANLTTATFIGAITANSITKSGGTSSQFLMADGSVSTGGSGISVTEEVDEFTATTAQTSFTLTQTPSINSKVKMYINGVRISNTAYSTSGTTLTYDPINNGGYALTARDRIQFDYFY